MEKEIQLIVSDLDGTLYYDGEKNTNELPAFNVEAIRKWQKAGYRFMLATGRTGTTADYFKQEYDLDVDMIACNGGKIILNKKTVYHNDISLENIKRMQRLLAPYSDEIDFVLDMDSEYKAALRLDGIIAHNYNQGNARLITIDEYCNLKEPAYCTKIFIPMKHAERQDFFVDLIQQEFKEELSFARSSMITLECCNRGIHKGSALIELGKILNLDLAEMVVIGDEENDIDMLKTAPNSYVMSHARDCIKAFGKNEIDSVADLVDLCLMHNKKICEK